MSQKWYKSWVVWTAFIALLAFGLGNWELYQAIGLTSDTFQTLANLILTLMIALGVINNPTSTKTF